MAVGTTGLKEFHWCIDQVSLIRHASIRVLT